MRDDGWLRSGLVCCVLWTERGQSAVCLLLRDLQRLGNLSCAAPGTDQVTGRLMVVLMSVLL